MPPDPVAPPWQERVDAAHQRLCRSGHVDPIVAVGTPSGRFAAGDAHLRAEIGSVTKVFTALLLSVMAQDGDVELDTTVADLVPAGTTLAEGVGRITLESLACHRSGLPRLPPGMPRLALSRSAATDPYAQLDATRLTWALGATRLRGIPGEAGPAYSNFGMGLLGHLLGRAGERPFDRLLTDRVLDPLGIAATTTFTDENLRQGHHRGRPVGPWHLAELAGAGGLRSPAADLLTLLEVVRDGSGPLAEAVAETLRPRSEGRLQVGLGWWILGEGDLLIHDGGTLGSRSEVRVEQHSGTVVVVLGDGRRGTPRAAASLMEPRPHRR